MRNEINSSNRGNSKAELNVTKIGSQNVLIILILGIAGQIAWAVENSWFNTFVFDEITPNPWPVAWMVAVSAITATLTTLIMGALSDRTRSRWGRRRPYILFGYITWGIVTALFPLVSFIKLIGIAVVMVIIADAIMTFFGSTANDAAYNAWITDIGDSSNRNRISSINSITGLIATLISIGVAGFIIDFYGYFTFFYILGGIVSISGLIAGLILKEPETISEEPNSQKKLQKEFLELLSLNNIRKNKILYLLFLNMALSGIASQIYFPYIFIYFEHYLGLTKSLISIIGGLIIAGSTVAIIAIGFISHKFNRRSVLIFGTFIAAGFLFTLGLVVDIWILIVIYMLQTISSMTVGAIHGGWLQDKYPEGNIGKFQGVRLIFMVLIPMVIGPLIGSALISQFGIPIIINGESGYVPTPPLLMIGALVSLLAIIPLSFIKRVDGEIHFKN
ncbi:MAG: MFS transporter [Candidatus Hodarchaeota archaeon]